MDNLQQRVWIESKKTWRLAFPAMLSRVLQYGAYVVTQAFLGKYGRQELAAYAVAQQILVRSIYGILLGMASATQTLSGQAYGAKQYYMMGIYLQMSWLIEVFTATILLPLFFFAKQIFRLFGEDDDVASKGGYLALWFIPVIFFLFVNVTIQQFLQAQDKNTIIGWISVGSFAVHVALSWLLAVKLGLGVRGAMAAIVVSFGIVAVGEVAYVLGGWCPDTWTGFSSDAFKGLVSVVKLSFSSGFMLWLELWYASILVLLAGHTSDPTTSLSAFSISINVYTWALMVLLGFYSSSGVRVANELGSGDSKAAKFSVVVNGCTSVAVGLVLSLGTFMFRKRIAYVFSNENDIVAYVSSLSTLLSMTILISSVQSVLQGALIGSGRQSMAAWVTLASYYVIGVPSGALLGILGRMQAKGLWIGMIIGMASQVLIWFIVLYKTNWDEEVKRASLRLNQLQLKKTIEEMHVDTDKGEQDDGDNYVHKADFWT